MPSLHHHHLCLETRVCRVGHDYHLDAGTTISGRAGLESSLGRTDGRSSFVTARPGPARTPLDG